MKQLTDVTVDASSPAHSLNSNLGSHQSGEGEAMQFSAVCFLVNITILNKYFIAKKCNMFIPFMFLKCVLKVRLSFEFHISSVHSEVLFLKI